MSPRILSALCLGCAVSGFQLVDALTARRTGPISSVRVVNEKPTATPTLTHSPLPSGNPSTPLPSENLPAQKQPQSLLELANACEKAGSPAQSRLALMEAISKLKPEELEGMLAVEAGNNDFFRSGRFDFQFAAKRLSEIAPEKAAALWLKTQAAHPSSDILLSSWAKKDPQAFASWSLGLPTDAQRALSGTMAQLVTEDPQRLLGIAAQLAGSPAGVSGARGAIAGMIAKASKGADPAEAIAYAQALPEGPMRTAALAELARWPSLDPGAHPEIAAALSELSPSQARRYLPQVTAVADKLPQGALRDSAYAAQMTGAAKKNPQAAAQKVESLSGSPDYPAAVRGFVEATATKDPAAAIEWALTIPQTGAQRSAALEKAAAAYFRSKPADALKWVKTAPLSSEEYLMLTGRTR